MSWISKTKEIVLFDRVICVKRATSTGSLVVRLEDNNCVTITANEVDDFIEAFQTWAAVIEITALGIEQSDLPIKKGEGR